MMWVSGCREFERYADVGGRWAISGKGDTECAGPLSKFQVLVVSK